MNVSLDVYATVPLAGRFASFMKNHPKHSSIKSMNDTYSNPSWPSRRNNLRLKLGLRNVRSIGKDDKLLSILGGDAVAWRLNVVVLTEKRHSIQLRAYWRITQHRWRKISSVYR